MVPTTPACTWWNRPEEDLSTHPSRTVVKSIEFFYVVESVVRGNADSLQNYTLVRQDRRQGPGGGLLFFIHNSVSFTRKPLSTTSKNDPHLEELTISIAMDNTELLISNVYIPPASSCNGCYSPPLDHLLTGTDSLVLGPTAPSCGGRSKELTANPGRRKRMRASPSQEDPTPHPR